MRYPIHTTLGPEEPMATATIALRMVLDLSGVVVPDPEAGTAPDHHDVAVKAAEAIQNKAGFGVDSEAGDLCLLDVDRATFHALPDPEPRYDAAELVEQAEARADWMGEELDAEPDFLGQLKADYLAVQRRPPSNSRASEEIRILHRLAKELGWVEGFGPGHREQV